ncbi:SDR family NAD(P)-dependent oxidoreductase [Streptomyces hoynatensis]|uniref:SDR family NAD(P)-dependent oxidoreductase n=1 Tax=Streptomyces hoynatensis TaxID=1141874 RepID=A0A3A9ZBN5_9ACTN|nr:SDR family NAD(P)-dependent oxidoreductase [Streptomyces hoynatensis]RKN45731.1 SDR family NAD(P)-dependent oxidoreductase [Streptomyces hoynatensis]
MTAGKPPATPRRWLITGANSGLGAAFTRAALDAGDAVVAGARRPETMAELAAEHPERLRVVRLDVTEPARCAAAVAAAQEAFGGIDVLVNNAGSGLVCSFEETAEEELRRLMEVMFFGPARLTRLVLPQLRARRSGTVVQVSSLGGLVAFAGTSAYSAAKGALEQASEALAAELAPLGVRVLLVEPGSFHTEFVGTTRTPEPLPEYRETVGALRGRFHDVRGKQPGDPDKAARALLTVLGMPNPPLRLVLGDDAVGGVRAKLGALAAELDATAALATGEAIAFA